MFRTKIIPGEIADVLAPVQADDSIEVSTTLSSRP